MAFRLQFCDAWGLCMPNSFRLPKQWNSENLRLQGRIHTSHAAASGKHNGEGTPRVGTQTVRSEPQYRKHVNRVW